MDGIKFDVKHAFIDPAPTQVTDLRRLVAAGSVDAVIADLGVVGAPLFHELTGVPWVSVGSPRSPSPAGTPRRSGRRCRRARPRRAGSATSCSTS